MGKKLENGPVQMPDDDIGVYVDNTTCHTFRVFAKSVLNTGVLQDPMHIKMLEGMRNFFAAPEMIEGGVETTDAIQSIRWDPNR